MMSLKKKVFGIIALLAFTLVFSLYSKLTVADASIAEKIKSNLEAQGVEVIELSGIDSVESTELNIKFKVVKTEAGVPELPDYIHAIYDEVHAQNKMGLGIKTVSIKAIDQNNQIAYESTVADVENKVNTANDFASNELSDDTIISNLTTNLPINNGKIKKITLDRGTKNPGKKLNLVLTFNDVVSTNKFVKANLLNFVRSIEEQNKKGAQIHSYKINIEDITGKLLLNMVTNLDYRQFTYWQDPAIDEAWFNSPPKKIIK